MPIFMRFFQFLLTINPKNRKGLFATVAVTLMAIGTWYLLPVEYKDDLENVLNVVTMGYTSPAEGGNNVKGTDFKPSDSNPR